MNTIPFILTALLFAASHEEVLPDRNFMCMQLSVLKNGRMICEQCDRCPAGMEPFPRCYTKRVWNYGTFVKDCHSCPKGYFKETEHPNSAPCLPCNSEKCKPFHKVKKECTPTSKRICSEECIDGYQKERTAECVPICCKCVSLSEKRVKRCQHTQDKHCAPINSTCKSPMDVKATPEKGQQSTTQPSQATTSKENKKDAPQKIDPVYSKPTSPLESSTTFKPFSTPKQQITITSSLLVTKTEFPNHKATDNQKKRTLPPPTGHKSPTKQKSKLRTTYKKSQTDPNLKATKVSKPDKKTPPTIQPTSTKPTKRKSKSVVPQSNHEMSLMTKILIAVVLSVFLVVLGLVIFFIWLWKEEQAKVQSLISTDDDSNNLMVPETAITKGNNGSSGNLCRRKSSTNLKKQCAVDMGQGSSNSTGEEQQGLLMREVLNPSLETIPEPEYPPVEETLAIKECVYCHQEADKPLKEVDFIILKFGNLKRYLNKADCDNIYFYLLDNDISYTNITEANPTADLYTILEGSLEKDLTIASFVKILYIIKKEGIVNKIHADFHPSEKDLRQHKKSE